MKFKNKKDEELFLTLHPILIMVLMDMEWFAVTNFKKNLTVTATVSTLEQDKKLGRVSSSHRQRRAADIRTLDLTDKEIKELSDYINNKWAYKEYRYISKSGVKRLAYYHNGTAPHLHVQLHSRYANFTH